MEWLMWSKIWDSMATTPQNFSVPRGGKSLSTFLGSRLNSHEPHSHQIHVQLSGSFTLPAATSHNPNLPKCFLKNRSKYLRVGLLGRRKVSRQGDGRYLLFMATLSVLNNNASLCRCSVLSQVDGVPSSYRGSHGLCH